MMTFVVLITLIACGDKDPGTTHDPRTCSPDDGGTGDGGTDSGGSDVGGSDTGIDLSHCDATGYLPWLEALVAEYEETGRCPEIPAEVPMLDGTMYVPEPVEYRTAGNHAVGEFEYRREVVWHLSATASSVPHCPSSGEGGLGPKDWFLSLYVEHYTDPVPSWGETAAVPKVLSPVWEDEGSGGRSFRALLRISTETGREATTYGPPHTFHCGYTAWCIEEFGSSPGPYFGEETPGGTLKGWAYLHTEQWFRDGEPVDDGGPMDAIVHFDGELDCTTYAEDASFWGPTHGEEWIWPNWDIAVCDGVDNDYDGEIDEGGPRRDARRLDRDDNGIPDCQQDCDGDGIPNYDDLDDLDECTPTGL